jgi:hypothetical protein
LSENRKRKQEQEPTHAKHHLSVSQGPAAAKLWCRGYRAVSG